MYYLHPRPLPDELDRKSVTLVSRCACRSCFGTSATTCRRRPETTRSPDSGSTWSGRWRTTSSPTTCPAASSSWSAGRRSSSRRMTSRWAGFESRRRWHFDHFNYILCTSRSSGRTRILKIVLALWFVPFRHILVLVVLPTDAKSIWTIKTIQICREST